MSPGLIGFYVKGILMDELFTMSQNWLVLKGSARPQMSKHQNTEN